MKDAIAPTTSFVKVLPAPDDPINTVGLMACQNTTDKKTHSLTVIIIFKHQILCVDSCRHKCGEIEIERDMERVFIPLLHLTKF